MDIKIKKEFIRFRNFTSLDVVIPPVNTGTVGKYSPVTPAITPLIPPPLPAPDDVYK